MFRIGGICGTRCDGGVNRVVIGGFECRFNSTCRCREDEQLTVYVGLATVGRGASSLPPLNEAEGLGSSNKQCW